MYKLKRSIALAWRVKKFPESSEHEMLKYGHTYQFFWRFSQFFGLLHLLKTLRGKMTKNFFVLVHALFDVDLIEKNRSAMRTCKGF